MTPHQKLALLGLVLAWQWWSSQDDSPPRSDITAEPTYVLDFSATNTDTHQMGHTVSSDPFTAGGP